jgi:predicted  nucleic acid-binding Zn-ribbon protein
MPHQCTGCGYVFEDGSKEMLSGCPDCGGNTFQFHPDGADVPDEPGASPPEPEGGRVGDTVGRATSTVRNLVGDEPEAGAPTEPTPESEPEPEPEREPGPESEPGPARTADSEDAAQASARTDVVRSDELPDPPERDREAPPEPTGDGRVVRGPTGDRPSLEELREELNEQFESIRIVAPGEYELNLMGLYNREEYVVALKENGRYVIQMPDDWMGRPASDEN